MKWINKSIICKYNYSQIIIICILFFNLISTMLFIISRGTLWTKIYWQSNSYPFSDFYMPIKEASDLNPYVDLNISPYPPMAFLIFYFISLIVERDIVYAIPWNEFHRYQSFVLIYFVLLILMIFMILYICFNYLKNYNRESNINFFTLFSILLSYPFIYLYERGNIVILTMTLSLIFVLHYDSSDTVKRYCAFCALAVAASIKIYPAIFGILLFKKQKLKDIFILVFLGIFCFLIPFAFFNGGFNNVRYFFQKLLNFETANNQYWIGIGSMLSTLEHFFKEKYNIFLNLNRYSTLLSVLAILPLVFFSISFKSFINKVFSICIAMCLFLTNAPYLILYFMIPLIFLLQSKNYEFVFLKLILIAIFSPFPILLFVNVSATQASILKALYFDLILIIAYIYFIVLFIKGDN